MSLGQQLREGRKAAKLTMAELGARVGVSAAAISRYELDQREPDQLTLIKICDSLGLNYRELCEKRYAELSANIMETIDSVAKAIAKNYSGLWEVEVDERELNLLSAFYELNDQGKTVAIERVVELGKIPEYKGETSGEPEFPLFAGISNDG